MAVFAVLACQDRETYTIENVAAPIMLDMSTQALTLDKYFPDNPALTLAWQVADYSQPTEISYKIETSATADFQKPHTLGVVKASQRTATYTVNQINTAAGILGLKPAEAGKMYFRVTSYLGEDEYIASTSNVTALTVTPYVLTYPDFYLVGAASYVGWTADKAQILYKSGSKSVIYTYLAGNEPFRFLGQQNWNPINYSMDVPAIRENYRYFKQVSSNIVADPDENMKFTGTTGIYKLEIDAAAGVQKLEVTASPLSYNYPNLYLVGSVNSWDAATAKAFTAKGDGVFELTAKLAADAEFKFIGQQSWGDLEWGNILKDNNGYSGFIGPKGDNGNVKFAGDGGDYKITVNLKAGTYSIVKP